MSQEPSAFFLAMARVTAHEGNTTDICSLLSPASVLKHGMEHTQRSVMTWLPARSLPRISKIPSTGKDYITPVITGPDTNSVCTLTLCKGILITSDLTP